MRLSNPKIIERYTKQKDFEAKHNLVGFFDLLFKIALRENIDIGQRNNDKSQNKLNGVKNKKYDGRKNKQSREMSKV